MSFHGVAFLLTHASFFTTFLINCDRGESLVTATCLKTVVEGMLPVRYFCFNKASFCVSLISWIS